ncbi:hypothetical protein L208DRAFT_1416363, partial [Tricholoma matsutake]
MLPGLERNASVTKDAARMVPKPVVVVAKINGHSVCALIDSGSLGDFLSTTLTDQLKINLGTHVEFQYQGISEQRYFDIMNISNYDLILGSLDMDLLLPPLQAINHTVPLIDENKIYPWRPSRCPEALRS